MKLAASFSLTRACLRCGASSAGAAQSFVVYTGSDTQLPDPTIEAQLGAGNAPAYRGQAYVVFTDLLLSDYGNQIPSLTFEVVKSGTFAYPPESEFGDARFAAIDPETGYLWATFGADATAAVNVYDLNTRTLVKTIALAGANTRDPNEIVYVPATRTFWVSNAEDSISASIELWVLSADAMAIVHTIENSGFNTTTVSVPGPLAYDPVFQRVWVASAHISSGGVATVDAHSYEVIEQLTTTGAALHLEYVADFGLFFLFGRTTAEVYDASGGLVASFASFGTDTHAWVSYNPVLQRLYWTDDFSRFLKVIQLPALTVSNTADIVAGPNFLRGVLYDAARGRLYLGDDNLDTLVVDPATYAVLETIAGNSAPFVDYFATPSANRLAAINNARDALYDVPIEKRLTPGTILLSEVVSDLSLRAGLAAPDINVSALTDVVDGYVIGNQGSARGAVEQLMPVYFFDAVESDNVVKFVKRGGASVATLTADDLAAHRPTESVPAILNKTRQQEVELPDAINVIYLNSGADYQQGNQQSKRLIGASGEATTFEVPIVLSDAKAKQVADVILFNAWTERMKHQLAASRKHAQLEPTDVIVADGVTLRITKKDEGAGGVIRLEGVAEDGPQYSQSALAAAAQATAQALALPGATQLMLLDTALLRDQDEGAGFYVAAAGFASGWRGAELFKSNDGGQSYFAVETLLAAATIGGATTALGTFSGGNIFDEQNLLTVRLTTPGATLSSTSEANVLNGANAFALKSGSGWEIAQCKNAVLNGDGTYTLSGFLRGRRGTEWAMSGHAVGDSFVWLSSATLERVDAGTAELNLARKFKAATFGSTLTSAAARDFTYAGADLECYAPVLIGGGREPDNDIVITWIRRTRVGGEWRDSVDAPLGEASESYEVDVLDGGGAVKRTLTASTPTLTYTSAQQTSDFGGATPNPLSVKVYQLSAIAGRGTPGSGQVAF